MHAIHVMESQPNIMLGRHACLPGHQPTGMACECAQLPPQRSLLCLERLHDKRTQFPQ